MQLDLLKHKLSGNLPGIGSHLKMSPANRAKDLLALRSPTFNPRLSAVMILFFHEDTKLKIVFIRRSEYVGIHSGQIAFPGGRYEESDMDLQTTAFREVEEEIGLSVDSIEILKQLTDLYVPPSNFLVRPFVGYIRERPHYVIDTREVQEILEFDFELFYSESCIKSMDFQAQNIDSIIQAPCFDIEGTIVWGATAMILTELLDLIRSTPL